MRSRQTTTHPGPAPTSTLATPDRDADETLRTLLDAELDYSPIARGDFINHLAMSLVAARRLGASSEELEEWYLGQTSDDFLVPRQRPAWLRPETEQVAAQGIDEAVTAHLPALVGAPSPQFFHAIIRLDLAVDAGHPGQVANALHNWHGDSTPLADVPKGNGVTTFAETVARLVAAPEAGASTVRDLRQIASSPWFAAIVDDLAVHDGLLDEIAAFAVASHTVPRNFGSLHLVTGTRAARALVRFLDDDGARTLAVRLAQAVAAAHLWFGAPPLATADDLDRRRNGPQAEWDEIARAAIASGDAHVAKLVYACHLEEQLTGDPLYRDVARRQAVPSSASRT